MYIFSKVLFPPFGKTTISSVYNSTKSFCPPFTTTKSPFLFFSSSSKGLQAVRCKKKKSGNPILPVFPSTNCTSSTAVWRFSSFSSGWCSSMMALKPKGSVGEKKINKRNEGGKNEDKKEKIKSSHFCGKIFLSYCEIW